MLSSFTHPIVYVVPNLMLYDLLSSVEHKNTFTPFFVCVSSSSGLKVGTTKG